MWYADFMTDFATLFDSPPTHARLADAFDSIEADITYIDTDDITRYFSPFRIFDRPSSCLNANIYECHPPHVHDAVAKMLDAFRAHTKDTVGHDSVSRDGRPVRICYHAIRNRAGDYLGCMEVVTYRD